MQAIEQILIQLQDFIWGPPLLILFMGVGLYLTYQLKGMQLRYLPYALKLAFLPQKSIVKSMHKGITPFQSLMTGLAATIGIGNIAGVATAITTGGLGALFWMWVTALLGMATRYSESVLAVKFRTRNREGQLMGGPMYYIEKGLRWEITCHTLCYFWLDRCHRHRQYGANQLCHASFANTFSVG